MTYAHITGDAIDHIGPLPRVWYDGTRWWDMRSGDLAPGWQQVETVPRPDDTDTTTHDLEYTVEGGVAVQRWTPRPWTAAEQASRAEQSARLDDLAARVARIEAHLWPAPPDPTDPDDSSVTGWEGVWPDGGLLREDGIIWRNVSGVPLTTPPSGFPGAASQWGHLFVAVLAPEPEPEPDPEPEPVDEWPAWVTWDGNNANLYQADAQVTHNGRRWTSTVGNNHWEPGVYGWTDNGPA